MTQNTVGCYTGWGKLKKVVVAEAEALEVIHLPSVEILKHETKKQLNLNFLTIQ